MSGLYSIVLVIHVLACLFMIVSVLLQQGKGAGLALYGGGGETLFSAPSGSSFMRKFTAGTAVTFAMTSLLLTLISTRSGLSSVTSRIPAPAAEQTAPATERGAPLGAKPGEGSKPPTPQPVPQAPKKP